MSPSPAGFEGHLAREIMRSERSRMAVLAALVGSLLVLFPALVWVYHEQYLEIFRTRTAVLEVLAVCLAVVLYELAMRAIVGRRLSRGEPFPPPLRFWNAFVETSVPSLVILLTSRYVDPAYTLQSAAGHLYAIFIVLSTLRLDFRLSAFTGVVAAVQYIVLAAVLLPADPVGTPLLALPFYVSKGAMLVLAGLAAGFVADQLKRRVARVLRSVEERGRVVAAFGQQVSPEIVEELLRQGPEIASRRRFVCVLFMDIRDFTRLVEAKSPEEIVAYQNAVFGAAVEAVGRHRGVINQFLGDGFMATFGAPVSSGDDCAAALAAARELLAAVKALADAGRIPATRVGIGLHAGEAVCGNIGSDARKQYSISGNVVIIAARIEQLNKDYGSSLLASAEVLRHAGEAPADAVALGTVQVKGRDEPVELYRLA